MKKIEVGQTVNTLANVGVIAGIAFLALELQQNNALIEAESLASMVSMNTEVWSTVVEGGEIADMVIKDRQGEPLTIAEEIRLNALWVRSLYNAEYVFEQAPERFPTVVWQRAFATYATLRRTWDGGGPGSALASKEMFNQDFVDFMDSTVFNRP